MLFFQKIEVAQGKNSTGKQGEFPSWCGGGEFVWQTPRASYQDPCKWNWYDNKHFVTSPRRQLRNTPTAQPLPPCLLLAKGSHWSPEEAIPQVRCHNWECLGSGHPHPHFSRWIQRLGLQKRILVGSLDSPGLLQILFRRIFIRDFRKKTNPSHGSNCIQSHAGCAVIFFRVYRAVSAEVNCL